MGLGFKIQLGAVAVGVLACLALMVYGILSRKESAVATDAPRTVLRGNFRYSYDPKTGLVVVDVFKSDILLTGEERKAALALFAEPAP